MRTPRSEPEPLEVVALETPAELAEPLQDALTLAGFAPAVWRGDPSPTATISLYLETAEAAERATGRLAEMLSALGRPSLKPVRSRLKREDWAESWKRHFRTERIGNRLVIRPSWEPYKAGKHEVVVELDPGMSFGTGRHGTTRACLEFLDRLEAMGATGSVLDLGCGSGILSIAAAKLGFFPVTAIDNDPAAVRTARENAAANGVGDRIAFTVADLASWSPPFRAGVVLANLLAEVLQRHAATLASAVAPGGRLAVSGILADQYPGVRAEFAKHRFSEEAVRQLDEWRSGLLRGPGKAFRGMDADG